MNLTLDANIFLIRTLSGGKTCYKHHQMKVLSVTFSEMCGFVVIGPPSPRAHKENIQKNCQGKSKDQYIKEFGSQYLENGYRDINTWLAPN